MKTWKLFLGASGVLSLASCSNDELTSVNRESDEIAFNVITNSHTRAADVYCNNNEPTQFYVSATHDGKEYIAKDDIQKINGSWKNANGTTRYWPKEGDVTFFGYHNGDEFSWDDGKTQPTITFTVADNVDSQKDFIYAKKTQNKNTNTEVVLNFRHALSQIVFQAKNTNPNLYVEIYGVSVCKVKNKGTFTFPAGDTDHKVGEHNGNGTIDYTTQGWGSWSSSTGAETYTVDLTDAVELIGSKTATPSSLTSSPISGKEYSGNAMLLLPQTTAAWKTTEAPISKPADQTGSYFLVKCKIYNVAAGNGEKGTDDICLWGAESAKDVAIPVDIAWEQGKKYIYTFVFGNGNGGYNHDDSKPVLVPITFNVTVDDFVSAGETEVNMKTNETNS